MFQGTPRIRSDCGQILDLSIPSWKLTSPFFNDERPDDLTFETGVYDCPSELHYTMRDDGRNISCPCLTSNIEISALASHITRELGWNKEGDPVLNVEVEDPIRKSVAQRFMWWQNRIGFRYQQFLQSFFLEQRMGEFLQDFKTFGEGGEQKKGEASMGFLARTDKQPMSTYMSQRRFAAYLCGDVIGIALAMRFMTTTNNRLLLAFPLKLRKDHVGLLSYTILTQPQTCRHSPRLCIHARALRQRHNRKGRSGQTLHRNLHANPTIKLPPHRRLPQIVGPPAVSNRVFPHPLKRKRHPNRRPRNGSPARPPTHRIQAPLFPPP
jgi:hypothetical protein